MAIIDYRFGYKIAWMAIRSEDQARVLEKFQFGRAKRVSWMEGIQRAYRDEGAFISSPVSGWILVVDRGLMECEKTVYTERLIGLSSSFGEAQYFLNYRVSSCHGWVRARNGKIERAYVNGQGEIYWDEGPITQEELALDLAYSPRPAKANAGAESDDESELYFPSEDDVLEIAGKWSIDPQTLNEEIVKDPNGFFEYCQSGRFCVSGGAP